MEKIFVSNKGMERLKNGEHVSVAKIGVIETQTYQAVNIDNQGDTLKIKRVAKYYFKKEENQTP